MNDKIIFNFPAESLQIFFLIQFNEISVEIGSTPVDGGGSENLRRFKFKSYLQPRENYSENLNKS